MSEDVAADEEEGEEEEEMDAVVEDVAGITIRLSPPYPTQMGNSCFVFFLFVVVVQIGNKINK